MSKTRTFQLKNKTYSALIEPQNGALVSKLVWHDEGREIDLLYSPQDRPKSSNGIHLFGCWPMVPFANRAFDRVLTDGVIRHLLPVNDPAKSSTIHGFGWQSPWNVEDVNEHRIRLNHACKGEFGPYHYRAEFELSIGDHFGFEFSLKVKNTGKKPLPFGIGFHPWFPCDKKTGFTVNAPRRVALGQDYRPIGPAEIDAESDFSSQRRNRQDSGRLVKTGKEIAVNFLDWHGMARLDYPGSHSLNIEATKTLSSPVLWTPGDTDFVCFEPQSHAIGAPSDEGGRLAAPLQVLQPGEAMEGGMRISAVSQQSLPRIATTILK